MAYTAIANDVFISAMPSAITENDRALKDDKVVNAGKVNDLITGNATGNIPISNGTVCTNLNAEKVGGNLPSAFATAGHTHATVTTSSNGLMINTDKSKLDGISAGAEVNQLAFSNVLVGATTIASDSKTDTLTLTAGTGMTLTPDATNDAVTFTITQDGHYHSNATTSANGFFSATDKTKLDGVATGAEVNQNAFSNIVAGGVTAVADSKADTFTINAGAGITVTGDATNDACTIAVTANGHTHTDATTSASGFMSATSLTKLNGIATGAEVNQNAFSNILVGATTIQSDSKTDTFEIVAGTNIALTPDATNDKVTINVSGTVANATNAVYANTAGSAPANGGTATTISGNIGGNQVVASRNNVDTDITTARELRWMNYGNSHTIVENSASSYPGGNVNAQVAWSPTYPVLMGYNGTTTYGVRVDSARVADSAPANGGNSTTVGGYTPSQLRLGGYDLADNVTTTISGGGFGPKVSFLPSGGTSTRSLILGFQDNSKNWLEGYMIWNNDGKPKINNSYVATLADIPTSLPANGGTSASCSGNSATATYATSAGSAPANGGTAWGIYNLVGDNDYIRIQGGSTGTNAGYLEIATADDGTEPIYVRQYTGAFTSISRTAKLLDESGNTYFPGTVYSNGSKKVATTDQIPVAGTRISYLRYTFSLDTSNNKTAHGLSGIDLTTVRIDPIITCVTANNGYSTGDVIFNPIIYHNSSYPSPITTAIDATYIYILFSTTTLYLRNKSTGASCTSPFSNWSFSFRITY